MPVTGCGTQLLGPWCGAARLLIGPCPWQGLGSVTNCCCCRDVVLLLMADLTCNVSYRVQHPAVGFLVWHCRAINWALLFCWMIKPLVWSGGCQMS